MDRACSIGVVDLSGGDRVCDNRKTNAWRWIDHGGADLANEFRHARKRATGRNRSALHFALRPGHDFLVELVARAPFALAYVDRAVDFSRARLARERSDPSGFFLRARRFCFVERSTMARPIS